MLAGTVNKGIKARFFFSLFAIIIIVVLPLVNVISVFQPKVMADEEPTEISLAGLPSKGNPKLDSVLNSILTASTLRIENYS